jgi:hypothetical protein
MSTGLRHFFPSRIRFSKCAFRQWREYSGTRAHDFVSTPRQHLLHNPRSFAPRPTGNAPVAMVTTPDPRGQGMPMLLPEDRMVLGTILGRSLNTSNGTYAPSAVNVPLLRPLSHHTR